ncbi:uncharacterized protein LOC126783981 [Argentina anserina]|uniref:uncharacterized protein LOC126783981 n=1 Tax=Argentina anserina TaxID=57926 RepID=UPI0021767CB1|nr:uncharacterized protein LOC126783981 [Potentilla anserina]
MDVFRSIMFLIPCISLSLILSFYAAVDGRSTTLSNIGELQLGKKLADPVKTIETRHGDTIDCVDIYKQPAFDHPLLKDHKIQMSPSFSQKHDVQNIATSSSSITIEMIQEGCPRGTVPIRRGAKEELTTAKTSFREQFPNFTTQSADDQPKLLYAGYSTKAGTGPHYTAGGTVCVNNPNVAPGQLSGSVLSVEGGPPEQFSAIRVGWIVNKNQFGDGRTHLYSVWGQATNGVMQGCYNTDCPGFVQIDKTIPLGMVFDQVSVAGGTQYYVNLQIQQDKASGNWWLIYAGSIKIGYWPSSLFTNLHGGADILRWGGQVTSSSAHLPPMGNGKADDSGSLYMEIAIDDRSASSLDDPAVASLEKLETGCYKVGDLNRKDDYHGYRFWFGGSGGDVQQCS